MAAVAINHFAYSFIKIHRTRRVAPAMAAGVTTRLHDVMDLVNLLVDGSRMEIPPATMRKRRDAARRTAEVR